MFIIYFENRMVITYLLIGMAEAGLLAYHWFRPGMTDKEYWMMVLYLERVLLAGAHHLFSVQPDRVDLLQDYV